jgi:hypothetical protein
MFILLVPPSFNTLLPTYFSPVAGSGLVSAVILTRVLSYRPKLATNSPSATVLGVMVTPELILVILLADIPAKVQ